MQPVFGNLSCSPFSSDLEKPDPDAFSEKCPPASFNHLRFYLSQSQNYTLEMSEAVACLNDSSPPPRGGGVQEAESSSGVDLDSLPSASPPEAAEATRPRRATQPNPPSKDSPVKIIQTGDRTLQRCKRKSSRLLGGSARKKWSPLKVLCIMESNKKRKKAKKKKMTPSFPSSKNPGLPVNSNEPTLKLKNLQNPLKRKRGAEVLSAEFVQRSRCELASRATSISEGLSGLEVKKPRLLKLKREMAKVKSEERMDMKQISRKSARHSMDDAPVERQQEAGDKNDPAGERTVGQDACPALKSEECDSHALNMLADLALSSCNTPLVSVSSKPSLPFSPSRDRRRLQRGKPLHKSSDHEYHRATKKWKGISLSSKTCQKSLVSPGQGSLSVESRSHSQERGRVSSSRKGRAGPAKPHIVLPKEAGDLSDSSMNSLISSEHSYASPVSESLKKGALGSPSAKNGLKNAKSGPLVGKVLPFRHQENICHPHKQFKNYVPFLRSAIMAARLKDDFSKSHKVAFCDKTVKVTFQWESEYLFSFDSKYTNNSLEKTVIRAVHGPKKAEFTVGLLGREQGGRSREYREKDVFLLWADYREQIADDDDDDGDELPWDISRSDEVEEMKLILHMWVALFYSKPFKSPTVRKVVEHSNPAKYVSLNSVVDPLELTDDCEGSYSLEKCPADSFSDANHMPSDVEERAVSPSEKPLSCNELSSTNCLEDETPLINPEESRELPSMEEQCHATAHNSEDAVGSFEKLADFEDPGDFVSLTEHLKLEHFQVVSGEEQEECSTDPALSGESLNVNALDVHRNGCSRPWAYRTDTMAEANRAINIVEASQSDAAVICAEPPGGSAGEEPIASNKAAVSVGSWKINSATPPAEEGEENHRTTGTELLHMSEAVWLDANADCREDESLCREVRAPRDIPMDEEDADGESVEWESIDLALSESNDADVEPRDFDLDQENGEFPEETSVAEERETAGASDLALKGCDSQFSSLASPAILSELPDSQSDSAAPNSPRNSASRNQTDSIEGFCLLEGGGFEHLVDSVPPQASPVHQIALDEAEELPRTDNKAVEDEHPVSPGLPGMDANAYVFQQGKGINSADLACTQTSELFQLQKDRAAQGEEAGSQGSPVPETTPVFADPVSVVDISCLPTENQGVNLAASISGHASPVHHTVPNKEFPEASKDPAESTRFPVSPNLMDFIEDISQESIHLADLHTSEHGQVQNGMSAQGESIENQEDTVMSASNLAEDMDWVCESCVPQAEEENIPADAALLQATPGGHTPSNKIAELSGSQGIPAVATKSAALPEQASMTEDSCAHQENKVVLPDMAPVHTDKLHQVQHRTVTHKVPKTGPVPELQKDSQGKKESQHLGLECMELDANSEKEMFCVSVGNAGASSVTQAVASEDKELNSTGVPVSEDTKAVVSELIDTVSAAAVEGEDSSAKENPDLNWISSITLECVTPPESDEESCTMGPWPQADPTWMAGECLEQLSTFADQERAIVQEQGQCPLVLHGRVRSGPAGMSARSPLREEEVASMDMDVHLSPCSSDWPEKDTASIDCNSPLAQPGVSSMDDRSTTPMLCDAGPGGASHDASASQGEVQFKGVSIEILATVPARCQKEHSSEGSDSAMHENTRGSLEGPEVSPTGETSPAGAVDTNMSWEKESFSVDGDQEVVEDPCHGSGSKSSCRGSAVAPGGGYSRDLDLDEDICTNGDWMYPENEKGSAAEREAMKRDWHFTFKEDDRSVSPLLETDNQPGLLKDYINFSVTKKHKEKTRTFHSSKGQDSFTGELGFIHSLNRTWRILNDPVQNTLDMECLRFHYKVKQVLKNPQYSTSTDTFTKGFSPQVIAETLPLRKVPDTDVSSPPPRSRSPLLITVVNPGPKPRASHWYSRSNRFIDSFQGPPVTCTQDSVSSAARAQCQGQSSTTPFHLNKLTYNNKLKDFRGNISVIMDEFAELSRVMMLDDRLTNNKGRDLKTTSEVAPEKSCPGRAASYEHLFNELCNALHFRLKNVAQEACKKPYAFYLMETDNDPFFGRVKNLLKKGGHTEAEPLRFCQTSHMETDKLMVVIRNEDIFPHIHKIPALLRLKHLPSVTFAGVDSPEDILEHTYQELFHSGGFVVTDDTVLQMMMPGELREVLQTLEQLSGHGRWKWLLHYKERKKLKESARVDPAARAKEALLQPCLGANIASVLHYHQCDCRSCPRDEFANCLLSLQAQHASERFAVFLTEKLGASREALESKGILVLDVNTFLATARDLVTPFRSSYW
ncbi:Protein TASOR 2 [Varanus komodoensis]|nr:Protein TASOR 2 [Varanus komodoensis]